MPFVMLHGFHGTGDTVLTLKIMLVVRRHFISCVTLMTGY